MLDPKKIEKFTRYLNEAVPKTIHNLKCDLDAKIQKIFQKQISRMNFISRDEFDMQTQILFETQKQLHQLEKKLENLELICHQKKLNDNCHD